MKCWILSGKSLEYKEYEPLFDCAKEICEKQHKKGYYVTCDTYVTMTDGTGIVHIAPAFGEDDAGVGRRYELPFVQLVDGKGELTKETPYAGVFVKKADPMVLKDTGRKKDYSLMHQNLNMNIHTAGVVIHWIMRNFPLWINGFLQTQYTD